MTDLVAPGVVNTMPEATLRAVAGHGQIPPDSVRGHYQDAQQVLSQLQELGIDYDDVTASLEDHALDIFDASWRELGDQLAAALRSPREGSPREGSPREGSPREGSPREGSPREESGR